VENHAIHNIYGKYVAYKNIEEVLKE